MQINTFLTNFSSNSSPFHTKMYMCLVGGWRAREGMPEHGKWYAVLFNSVAFKLMLYSAAGNRVTGLSAFESPLGVL